MTSETYKKALDAAREELFTVTTQQELSAQHIAKLRHTITQLERLIGETPTILRPDMGISQACREILEAFTEPMTPVEIKQELQGSGYDLSRFNNVMSTIHSALKRLAKQGDICMVVDDAGTKKYTTVAAELVRLGKVQKQG